MSGETKCPVAREGWPFIVFPALAALVSGLAGWNLVSALLVLAALFSLFFYRDPPRRNNEGPNVALAPADGRIRLIESVEDPRFPEGKALRVVIFLSIFNVHINRAPLSGRVVSVKYTPGKFLNALSDRSSGENENNAVAMETEWGYIEIKQIAGLIARRIVCRVRSGERLERGQRFGMIRFGSRTEALLPAETELCVKIGDRVRAGATALGRIPAATRS